MEENNHETSVKKKSAGSKLKPAVHLWPAILTGALAVAMVSTHQPQLLAVPELLQVEAAEEKPSEPAKPTKEASQTPLQAAGNFTDGVYVGSAQGYGGPIKVQVTVEGGNIVSVEILSAEGETDPFFNLATGVIQQVLIQQTWDVDVISGATLSSRGILGAIKNALTGEEVKNEQSETRAAEAPVSEAYEEPAGGYVDGTYYGSANGFGGVIQVEVVVANGELSAINIVRAPGETEEYFSKAKAVIERMLSAKSPNVDIVSGATYSSNGIINAVKKALAKAVAQGAAGTENLSVEEQESPAAPNSGQNNANKAPVWQLMDDTKPEGAVYQDGVYTGSAQGFGGDVDVSVTVKDGKIASVEVLSAEDETPTFFAQAVAVIEHMLQSQSTNVDTISGATYSSNGIINATRLALSKALTVSNTDTTEAPKASTQPVPAASSVPVGDKTDTTPAPSAGSTGKPNITQTPAPPHQESKPVVWKDGVYQGTGEGFGGDIVVEVTIKDGRIASVEILEADDETPAFLENAKALLPNVISYQTADVDTISGATFSSEGIKDAIAEALAAAEVSVETQAPSTEPAGNSEVPVQSASPKPSAQSEEPSETVVPTQTPSPFASETSSEEPEPSTQPEPSESTAPAPESEPIEYQDGIYKSSIVCTDDMTFYYTLQITVTVKDGRISAVAVDKTDDESDEPDDNDTYIDYAVNGRTRKKVWYEGIPGQLIEKQNPADVDVISGATYSSRAVIDAAREALQAAK